MRRNMMRVLLAATALALGGEVHASTLTVQNLNDSGTGSLRQAILDAASGDTITFASGVTGTITLASPLPAISQNLTITGPGASVVTVSGNNNGFQVFYIPPAGTVSISGLTIANGGLGGLGRRADLGGGINNQGTLDISNSTLSGNNTALGGGIFNPGTLTISNSTLSGNCAPEGGGIYNQGTLTISNSTLSGNSAGVGGGINNATTLTISNSTLSGNSTAQGGGIHNHGTLTLGNTVVANSGGGGGDLSSPGTVTSNGHNLIDDNSFASNGITAGPGDILNQPAGLDPAGLKDNGGPTQTIALLSTSKAIGAGGAFDPTRPTDQRGFPRAPGIAGDGGSDLYTDIGAFEFQFKFGAHLVVKKTASSTLVLTGTNVTYTIAVTNQGPDIAANVTVTDNLPAQLTLVSCQATGGGVCSGSGNSRTITFGALAPNETETITLVASVNCNVADGASIANAASVASTTLDPAPNAADSSSNVAITASNPPPTITGVSASPNLLWPPNGKLVPVTINYTATDACGTAVCALSVVSSEPPITGDTGDGEDAGEKARPQFQVVDAHHVLLRAQRNGDGPGRVYTITITCTNAAGGSSTASVTVTVPHDRDEHGDTGDDGDKGKD